MAIYSYIPYIALYIMIVIAKYMHVLFYFYICTANYVANCFITACLVQSYNRISQQHDCVHERMHEEECMQAWLKIPTTIKCNDIEMFISRFSNACMESNS